MCIRDSSKIESNQIGDVKLFGDNSLFLNNTKSIWFDKESKMDDIFLTEDEFYFFIEMFEKYLFENNFPLSNNKNLIYQTLTISEYAESLREF